MQYSSFNEVDVIAGWHTELDKLVSSSVAQKTKLIPRMFTGFWVIEFDFFQSGTEYRMFIVFWDTGSHIFQSDPNNNSDSTALFGHELKSDPNCSSRVRSISGGISKKSGSI